MIDVQPEIYTIGRDAVISQYPNAELSSTYTLKPTRFPYVSIIEEDNSTYKPTADSQSIENHALIMVEVNVYTTGQRKQQEARAIIGLIDETYGNMGLRRRFMSPVHNYNDTQVYRLTARYDAVISKNKQICRR